MLNVKQKIMSLGGEAMMSPGGPASSTGMPPDQKVNKADELTYLSTNIVSN